MLFEKKLRATACNASLVLAIIETSVRPSHPGTASKQRHLESRNLNCGLPQKL